MFTVIDIWRWNPGPSYCDTSYSRGSVNQMWILKLFTDMLGYIQPWPFSSCNSITILSSLPSTQLFPHSKLKDRLKELVQRWKWRKHHKTNPIYSVLTILMNGTDIDFLYDDFSISGRHLFLTLVNIPRSSNWLLQCYTSSQTNGRTKRITWFIYHHFHGFLNYTSVFTSRVYC
jgi:hypothetical protein